MADSNWVEWICSSLKRGRPLSCRNVTLPVEPGKCEQSIQQLVDLLNQLIVDHVRILRSKSDGSIWLMSPDEKMKAHLSITINASGALSKIDLVPTIPSIANASDFASAMSELCPTRCGIYIADGEQRNFLRGNAEDTLSVASLVKIVVAAALCYKLSKSSCDAEQSYCIRQSDLSPFSLGFGASDIGNSYSVADLVTSMLLMSDNTAMDILLRIIGEYWLRDYENAVLGLADFEPVQSTKTMYGGAWKSRSSALSDVEWPHEIGYFFSLRSIVLSTRYFVEHRQLLGTQVSGKLSDRLFFKGGSEPGVISTVWHCRRDSDDFLLAFALNRLDAFSLLEQIYVHQCAWQLLKSEGVVDNSSTLFFRKGV